jgi:hypothetical protein
MVLPAAEVFGTRLPSIPSDFQEVPMSVAQRSAVVLCLLAGTVLAGGAAARAEGSILDADLMRAALRTATPEENEFIDYVVVLVNRGRLPVALVESTFQWARRKSRHRFQYFRQALIVRAAEQRIRL